MKRKTYYEPLYKLYLTVFVESDPEKAKKIVESLIDDTAEGIGFNAQAKTIEYMTEQGGQRLVMWLRRPEPAVFAHELIHVVEYCFERRRIPFALQSSEVIAYYIEHLYRVFEPLLAPLYKVKTKKV